MYKITVFVDHDLITTAHLTSGLCELERRNLATVSWRMPLRMDVKRMVPLVVRIEVTKEDGQRIRHSFDFRDASRTWDEAALAWCDLYWKPNYHEAAIAMLPPTHRNKVRRYGLYFPARSRHDHAQFRRLAGSMRAKLSFRQHSKQQRLKGYDVYAETVVRFRGYKKRLFVDEYESTSTNRPIDVYFHPGCWSMALEEFRQVNFTRRGIIQGLRRTFGEGYVGGFVNNAHAQTHFPEEVYPHPIDHRTYVDKLQNTRVVVSTNGLYGCHSWRSAEALAAGAILVTETPVNEIDAHIRPGKNIFYYNTPAECVALCQNILNHDDGSLNALHAEAQKYYACYLEPGNSLLHRLMDGL